MQCLRIWRNHCNLPRPALRSTSISIAGGCPDWQVKHSHPHTVARAASQQSHSTLTTHSTQHFKFHAPTEAAMSCLASLLAMQLQRGDCYCLEGDVGAGKSVFCREFIRQARQDADLPVPSPTFLLENVYEAAGAVSIHHFDLYRLKGGRDMDRLGIETSLAQAICLVEWPQRLLNRLPREYLGVHIQVLDAHPASHSAPLASSAADISNSRHVSSVVCSSTSVEESHMNEFEGLEAGISEYTDQKPRQVVLAAHGRYWQTRVRMLVQLIRQEMDSDDELDGLTVCLLDV